MPTHNTLEPIAPETAQELYLDHKQHECSERTVQAHRYRTNHLVRWCDQEGIDNLNTLTGRHLQEYRLWRKEDGDLKPITLNQQMSTLRVFLKWAGSIEAVPENLYDKVMVPRVSAEQEQRDETLDSETAEAILEYLSRYHFASIEHVALALLWETGLRISGAVAIDWSDVDLEEQYIQMVHRPGNETPLKNGQSGERLVALSDDLADLLEEYHQTNHNTEPDEDGRVGLLTTSYGRMHRCTLRGLVYRVTAPCFRNLDCPDCTGDAERKCPEAVSPHAIRRGSITHLLSEDVPVEIVGDRMDVSRDVIDAHYDKRDEAVKLEQRREVLETI